MLLLLVAIGGAIGAVARFLVTEAMHRWLGDRYPWGTLAVNVSGSFALGVVLGAVDATPVAAALQSFVAIGLLGDFTTFSTFSMENATMLRARVHQRVVSYLLVSAVACMAAVAGGMALSTLVRG